MENEMIVSTEAIETVTEEVAKIDTVDYKKSGLIAAGVATLIIGGVILWKKVVKPAIAKAAQKKKSDDCDEQLECEFAEADDVEVTVDR